MKYLRQLMIILLISFAGELLKAILPLPIPASIYGLVIMLGLLLSKKLSLDDVKETAIFLVQIMPIMFIPPAVGVINSWDLLFPVLLPFAVSIVFGTIFVMVVAGRTTQFIVRRTKRRKRGRK